MMNQAPYRPATRVPQVVPVGDEVLEAIPVENGKDSAMARCPFRIPLWVFETDPRSGASQPKQVE